MSIIELGALGEFLGSIGVIATLIYLAVQIRQNTRSLDEGRKLATAQAYQARAEMGQDANARQADSPFATAIFLKVHDEGLDALTAEEHWRMYRYSLATLLRHDNTHYQYQQGFFDQEYYESVLKPTIQTGAPMWQALGLLRTSRPDFREEIERILAESQENEQ